MRRFNVLKWTALALAVLILAVLQMQAAFYPRFMDITPLFLVPAVVSIAVTEGETAGGIYGIVAGLFWDSGTGRAFGFNALFLMIIGIAVGLFVKFLLRNTALSAFLFTLLFTLSHEFVTWFFFYYMTGDRDLAFSFLHVMLPTVGLTAVFTLPLFFGLRAVSRRLTSQDSDVPM